MLIAVYFMLTGNSTIVQTRLIGYSYVTQFFPAVIARLMQRSPATAAGAFCGILAGAIVTTVLTFTGTTIGTIAPSLPQAVKDLNVGIIALVANIAALVAVGAATRRSTAAAVGSA